VAHLDVVVCCCFRWGLSPYVLLPMVSKFGWGGRATVSFIAGWSWLWREVAGGESLGTLFIF
jgi:hypothetical protein